MPISFSSNSHGHIPIGFFNIETDMLLMGHYFFFSTGFIGEVYKLFPFPVSHAGFKQKPYGTQNRLAVEQTIQAFAVRLTVPIVFHQDSPTIGFGDYTFSAVVFQEIIKYIEAGGMPGWLNGKTPDYVSRMMAKLANTHPPSFKSIDLLGPNKIGAKTAGGKKGR